MSWLDARCYPAAWVGLAIFFLAIRVGSMLRAALMGFVFGILALGASFHWAPNMLALSLVSEESDWTPLVVFGLLAIWEGLPYACLGAAVALFKGGRIPLWLVPAGWIQFEWVWPRVFPWSFAHTQTSFLPLIQTAEIGGVYLISFLMILSCLDVATKIERRELFNSLRSAAPIGCLGAALLLGCIRLWVITPLNESAETLQVGVVQVDPSFVDSTRRMRSASDKLPKGLDLVVWPESTLGTYSSSIKGLFDIKRSLKIVREPFVDQKPAVDLGTWLLVGGKTYPSNSTDENSYYQTAFLIEPGGRFHATYHKRTLMPIGEYVPGEHSYPFLHDWAQLDEYVNRGESDEPVDGMKGAKIGVLICYEEIVSEMARRTVAQGANVLVSLINASAFEDTVALEQHLRLAMLRAVENRRALIRCSGTGISCLVSPMGVVSHRLSPNEDAQFAAEVPLNGQVTIYGRLGYLFPHASALAIICYGLVQFGRKRS